MTATGTGPARTAYESPVSVAATASAYHVLNYDLIMTLGSGNNGKKPLVLLAARPVAREPFRDALGNDAEIVEAETLEQAVAQLKKEEEPQLVCCTVYFDESRMFDLLRWIRAERAHIPVVCARAMPKDITKVSMEAVKIAVNALGAKSFIDVPVLAEKYGKEAAKAALRLLLLNQLPGTAS